MNEYNLIIYMIIALAGSFTAYFKYKKSKEDNKKK
ncbi:hypothetical protein SAMN05216262_12812 [Colwellia chukchiensis]|uniref:Uncharacterized protein n=2 Tax=Colwelliaceae TaxID=267889 RepID=A0A7X0TSC5_9GAMM|nr:hypothetical protein [Thalassotalea piscium]SEL87329.1 hypothetical protein SAMN05216262_12812 [Colwellia chukchiensis]